MSTWRVLVVALAVPAISLAAVAWAQHQHGSQPSGAGATPPAPAAKKAPIRVTTPQLHHGPDGVPPGWRFSWPEGDPKKGREAFARLECYQCHEVPGAGFPEVKPDPMRRGPALAGMGGMHPAEYFAESILNPNAVIVTEPGFTGADGLSIMPDFRDSLTLAEAIDLVAYVRSLTEGGHHHDHGTAPREQVSGSYRVRLAYAGPGAHEDHGAHHHHRQPGGQPPGHGPQHGAQPRSHQPGPAASLGHLMVFVTDAVTGEPVPYLPITVTIESEKTPARTLTARPMLADAGFHYGANVTLPENTRKISVAIGRPTIGVMPSRTGRPPRAQTSLTFEWSR
jgi:hypothetical protein